MQITSTPYENANTRIRPLLVGPLSSTKFHFWKECQEALAGAAASVENHKGNRQMSHTLFLVIVSIEEWFGLIIAQLSTRQIRNVTEHGESTFFFFLQ